jgi:RND superfamily putative drug exporter
MTSFIRWVLAHKRTVVVAWIIVSVAAIASVQQSADALSKEFQLPGRESTDAASLIEQRFGNGGNEPLGPLVSVVQLPEGTTVDTAGVRAELAAAFGAISRSIPGSRSANFATTGDRVFVSKDGRTTFSVIWYPASTAVAFEPASEAITAAEGAAATQTVAGAPIRITGIDALSAGDDGSGGQSVLVETLIGGLGALIVLLFVFGSAMAFVPLLMAVVAIPTCFLLLWPLAEATEVSIVVEFLIALIGLGVAIDYSLLIVMRWREEIAAGREKNAAVLEAMQHAGRAVIFSGLAVSIGLIAMVVLPVPILRSIGFGGLLIPMVSVLVALTLLPVILATIGPRLDRIGIRRRTSNAGQGWVPWARLVVRRRWIMGGIALAILGALFIPVLGFSTGAPQAKALASAGSARDGLDQLTASGIGPSVLSPYEVAVVDGDPDATARAIAAVEGVQGVIAPDTGEWRRGGTAVINAFPTREDDPANVSDVRAAADELPGTVLVGGAAPRAADFNDAVYGNFIWVVLLIVLVSYVMLARVFRSLLLPLKAIVFNILSIGAVWGFMVVVWQNGHGSSALFGIEPTGTLNYWIPLIVFAFLYGLSMDYEVFILSRMREEYDRDGSTDRAVVAGLARTGRLVTAGSLILFLAFVALAASPGTDIKVLATALAFGIVLDATVVRSLLLPAFVSILGRWNWWMPPWAAAILRVEPSMPAPERRGSVPLGLEPADQTQSVASGLHPTPAIEAE